MFFRNTQSAPAEAKRVIKINVLGKEGKSFAATVFQQLEGHNATGIFYTQHPEKVRFANVKPDEKTNLVLTRSTKPVPHTPDITIICPDKPEDLLNLDQKLIPFPTKENQLMIAAKDVALQEAAYDYIEKHFSASSFVCVVTLATTYHEFVADILNRYTNPTPITHINLLRQQYRQAVGAFTPLLPEIIPIATGYLPTTELVEVNKGMQPKK